MSVDLTFALAATHQQKSIEAILLGIDVDATELGYARSPNIVPVVFDQTRGVFEEYEALGGDESDSSTSVQANVVPGAAVEYTGTNGATFYLMLAEHSDGYINAFIDVSARTFDRLLKEETLSGYMGFVCVVAVAIGAAGGFATFDLPFTPLQPDQVLDNIKSTPTPSGGPAILALIAFDSREQDEVQRWAGSDYGVTPSTAGFWVLAHADTREAESV